MVDALPRRDRILAEAERLFRHYGPAKTTMADIAKASGVGVGSVYLDFPSKEAILDELARGRAREIARRMRAAAPPELGAHDRLVRMFEARAEALFDAAEGGVHACELVRCGGPRPSVVDPTAFPAGFGADERAALREVVEALPATSAGPLDADQAIGLLEVAFAPLSPPSMFRLERHLVAALTARLARLVVFGIGAGAPRRPKTDRNA